MKYKILLLFFLLINSAHSFELSRMTSTQTSIAYAGTADSTISRNKYFIANRVVAPSEVTGYIPFNKKVGILTFSVLVPTKSKIYMKWDNPNNLYSRIGKIVKFRRAGEYRSLSFNATKLISGYIYLYNENNKLLKKIHYKIKKQRAYSQNIRVYARDSQSSSSRDSNISNSNIGIGYSISQRVNIGEPSFSAGISISTDLNNNANKTITGSFGYSW